MRLLLASIFSVAALAASSSVIARQERLGPDPLEPAVEEVAPPAPTPIALANPGFESAAPASNGAPAGWIAAQHAGEISYTFELDDAVPRNGRYTARIDNVGAQPFGILYQLLPGTAHVGKRLRFSADVRTTKAGTDDSFSGAVLVLQAMRAGAPLAVERMADRALRGDHPWQRQSVELTMPPGTDQVQVGVMLMGNGTVWVDDAALVSLAVH